MTNDDFGRRTQSAKGIAQSGTKTELGRWWIGLLADGGSIRLRIADCGLRIEKTWKRKKRLEAWKLGHANSEGGMRKGKREKLGGGEAGRLRIDD
jgi:hypothetical protein